MNIPAVISATISDGPLTPISAGEAQSPGWQTPAAGRTGAIVSFEGIVRADEGGKVLRALAYAAYEPMASRGLRTLAEEVAATYRLLAVHVAHSRGEVPVDSCSFRLTIHAVHRKEALAAMDEFIDRMKRDVPIWKTPVWS